MKLSKLKSGEFAIITSVNPNCISAQRLVEIGFSAGTEVSAIIKGMSPHLTAYKVKNTVIALRDKTADNINVSLKEGGSNER